MDNRKVYKNRSKTQAKSRHANMLSKVKGLVSSFWNKNEDSTPSTPSTPISNSIASNSPTVQSDNDVNKTPNVLLSEFFHQKGNTPLSAVEYEGVMSLLSQSHKSDSPLMPGSFTRYDSPVKSVGSVAPDIAPVAPMVSDLLIESTPSQQKVLRNAQYSKDPTPFATPDHKHLDVSNTSINTLRRVPSVKRVYQFSGLPSPYRTRIKAPVLPSGKRAASNVIEKSVGSSKPLNKAATTLLSVLDDNKSDNSYLQQFSNPYMGKTNMGKKHKLAADVINSTMMFDQSTDLPDTASNNSSVTTPAASVAAEGSVTTGPVHVAVAPVAPVAPVSVPAPGPNTATSTSMTTPSVTAANTAANTATNTAANTANNTASNSNQSSNKNGSSKPFSFKSDAPKPFSFQTEAPKAAKSEAVSAPAPSTAPVAPTFAPAPVAVPTFAPAPVAVPTFAPAPPVTVPAPAPTAAAPPTAASPAPKSAPEATNSFTFPDVTITPVNLDPSTVQLYKSLFSFM